MFSLYLASRHNQQPAPQAGFSLVELLVSVAIIVLVLSIVITQQNSFNSAALLRSQAYEVATDIRMLQLTAVSATNDASGGSDEFRSIVGLHFNTGATANHQYELFVDGNGDGAYTSADSFYAPTGLLDPRFVIADIRPNGGAATPGTSESVSITFERPNFDALFSGSMSSVHIVISPEGVTPAGDCESERIIEVTSTGQVTVLDC